MWKTWKDSICFYNFRYQYWTPPYRCMWKHSELTRLMGKHSCCWAQPCSWSTSASSWGPPSRYATSLINSRCSLDLAHIFKLSKILFFQGKKHLPIGWGHSDFHFMQAFTIVQQCTEYRFYIELKSIIVSMLYDLIILFKRYNPGGIWSKMWWSWRFEDLLGSEEEFLRRSKSPIS